MLTAIRDRASGWIAWFIVGLLCIPFAFWGISEYFQGEAIVDIADINGVEIDYYEYQNILAERRRQMSAADRDADPEWFASRAFKRQVVDELVRERLLAEDAQDHGYRISDGTLAQYLREAPDFQRDNQFDRELYLSTLSYAGQSVAQFEDLQRRRISAFQMEQGLHDSGFALDSEVRRLAALELQERTAQFIVVKPEKFTDDITVTDEEISEEYASHPARYTDPARMRVEYVRLSVDDIKTGVAPGEDDIQEYYEQNERRYLIPEQREASHILIEVADDAETEGDGDETDGEGDDADAAALKKAEDLLARIRDGEDFAALAMEHSADPGSAQNGGDLGVIERGVMVPPFEEAVFAMTEEGELRGPVKTQFGYHIIRLTRLAPEQRQELDEEVHDEIAETLALQLADELFAGQADILRNIVYEQPDSLAPAAEELGLEVAESEWFDETGGDGIAAYAKVREAAFGDEVLQQELNSEAVELDLNTLVALRKLDHAPRQLRDEESVREEIRERLTRNRARQLARERGLAALETLRAAEGEGEGEVESEGEADAWTALAEELEQTITDLPARRDGGTPEQQEILYEVFTAARPGPADGAKVYGGLTLADGGYAIFALSEVTDADPDSDEGKQAQNRIRFALRRRHGEEYYLNLVEGLRQRAEVRVYGGNL